jgi:primary-amine oxidase
MPTAYIGFLLKPAGFFNLKPANDVPPSPKQEKQCCH